MGREGSPSSMHRSIHVPLGFALGDVLPLIGLFSPLPDADQDLGPSVDEVDLQWHERGVDSVLGTSEFEDFPLVSQKNPGSDRLMLTMGPRRRILRDMNSLEHQRCRIGDCPDPALSQTRPAGPNRLDLGSEESEPAFQSLPDEIVMPGASIFDHHSVGIRGFLASFGHPNPPR